MNTHENTLKDIIETIDSILAKNHLTLTSFDKSEEKPGNLISLGRFLILSHRTTAEDIIKKHHKEEDDLKKELRGHTLLFKAAIFQAEAEIHRESFELNKCIQSLNQAAFYLGAMTRTVMEVKRENDEKSKNALNAAQARHSDFHKVKEKVKELLATKKPHQGWQSQSNAAMIIAKEIVTFIENEKLPITKDNIESNIVKWLRNNDCDLRTTYIENASPKARDKLKKP